VTSNLVSDDTLRAWLNGAEENIESGVATDMVAVCPLALRRACRELIERRSRVETRADWRPINTAPRDGTVVLLFGPKGLIEGSWDQVDGGGHPENGPPVYWWTSPHMEFIDGPYDAPTHWMPFPALPEQVKTGDDSLEQPHAAPHVPSITTTTTAPVCETCGTELAFEGDVCGLCLPVAQP
jgi:hypothetical protein